MTAVGLHMSYGPNGWGRERTGRTPEHGTIHGSEGPFRTGFLLDFPGFQLAIFLTGHVEEVPIWESSPASSAIILPVQMVLTSLLRHPGSSPYPLRYEGSNPPR